MRIAFGAALSAVCFVMSSAAVAADVPAGAPMTFASVPGDGAVHHIERRLADGVRLGVDLATVASIPGRANLDGSRRFRLESSTVDYFPLDNGFRLSFGLRRDKVGRIALRGSDNRADRAFTSALGGGSPTKRHMNPGVGVGYDEALDGATRLSFDGGFRMMRRDGMSSQLMRLASASGGSNGGILGARTARFGPSVRLSLIRKF